MQRRNLRRLLLPRTMNPTSFERRSEIPVSARELQEWHLRPGAFSRLNPPWEEASVVESPGALTDGAVAVIDVGPKPFSIRWIAEHELIENGFIDSQTKGPFSFWVHRHLFQPKDDSASELIDSIRYRLPLGWLGEIGGGKLVEKKLDRMFRYRHEITRCDLVRAKENPAPRSLSILVTGSTGLIGSALCGFLETQGHRVLRVTRSPRSAEEIRWNPQDGTIDLPKDVEIDAVIHLAGSNVADGRWSEEKKREILESRVLGTQLLAKTMAERDQPPSVFVSASGSGFYPLDGEEHDESSDQGYHFLAQVCSAWEDGTAVAEAAGIRVVLARIGVVLTPAGGALQKMLPIFRSGLGGVVGKGDRMMSWISFDDVLDILHRATWETEWKGPLNLTAPKPVSHHEFFHTLAQVLRRPCLVPSPEFAIRALFGEMADETLLADLAVIPDKLTKSGYTFRYPDLTGALCHLLGKDPLPKRGSL